MDDSILITTKKLLGLDDNYTPFDQDIIVFINSAMMVLQQLGVGPLKGFTVSDATQTWADFLPSPPGQSGMPCCWCRRAIRRASSY